MKKMKRDKLVIGDNAPQSIQNLQKQEAFSFNNDFMMRNMNLAPHFREHNFTKRSLFAAIREKNILNAKQNRQD